MPTLQTVLPREIADAVGREAARRRPKTSKSRVIAEIVIGAFDKPARRKPAAKEASR